MPSLVTRGRAPLASAQPIRRRSALESPDGLDCQCPPLRVTFRRSGRISSRRSIAACHVDRVLLSPASIARENHEEPGGDRGAGGGDGRRGAGRGDGRRPEALRPRLRIERRQGSVALVAGRQRRQVDGVLEQLLSHQARHGPGAVGHRRARRGGRDARRVGGRQRRDHVPPRQDARLAARAARRQARRDHVRRAVPHARRSRRQHRDVPGVHAVDPGRRVRVVAERAGDACLPGVADRQEAAHHARRFRRLALHLGAAAVALVALLAGCQDAALEPAGAAHLVLPAVARDAQSGVSGSVSFE